jgi:lysophospholipase L1-like esterase
MKNAHVQILVTLLATAALAACGGSGATSSQVLPLRASHVRPQSTILSNIVGVGDSLTAGYQSNGFLGATGVRINVNSQYYPVFQGQENGWWADLYEQASGKPLDTAIDQMYDPSTSPLPLIAKPGLNNQIIPWDPQLFPIQEQKSGNVCTDNNGFNEAGYHLKGISRVRMDPDSTEIRDVGIPGLTLHEANVLHQPQTDTCKPIAGIPGLLSMVVADESATFWPVLGNFTKLGPNLTDVNAAASRHPTLATVWLGANDVLKYMGSGGRFVGGDRNAAQAEEDLRATFSTLQHAGAHVVVANLPNILETGYFQRVTNPKSFKDCALQTYAWCLLTVGISTTKQQMTAIANQYHLSTPNGCVPASETKPCGYLTLQGAIEIIQYATANQNNYPNLDCAVPSPHCKAVPGSGLGNYYITPEFAGKIQALNDAINQGIDDASTASHVPLVDVQAIFHGLASENPSDPYFKLASSINPGTCCYLGYLYGILSFDGLHPSNTGYALIAYVFIDTINKAYGTHIPQIDIKAVYSGTRCAKSNFCYPDPYAPPNDISY